MLEAQILRDNRNFAELEVDKNKRYRQILEILENNEMTAKEISVEMYKRGYTNTDERNTSAPRLTELLRNGLVEVINKKKCRWTGKTVSVFKRRNVDGDMETNK